MKKVTTPPRTSRAMVEPRSVIWKKASRRERKRKREKNALRDVGVCTHDAILPDATGPARAATTVRMFRSGGSRPGRGAVDHLEATAESSAGSRPGPGRRGRLEP